MLTPEFSHPRVTASLLCTVEIRNICTCLCFCSRLPLCLFAFSFMHRTENYDHEIDVRVLTLYTWESSFWNASLFPSVHPTSAYMDQIFFTLVLSITHFMNLIVINFVTSSFLYDCCNHQTSKGIPKWAVSFLHCAHELAIAGTASVHIWLHSLLGLSWM